MALEVINLTRVFKYKDVLLDDVPGADLKEVARTYSSVYPELLNSIPQFVEIVDDKEIYTFEATAGTKG